MGGWRRPPDGGWLARLRGGADRVPGVGVHRSRLLQRYPPLLQRSGPRGAACRPCLRSDRRRSRIHRSFHAAVAGNGSSEGTVPAYDLGVVDDAIVNAVAHRDYAIAGSKIRLFLFADRLEPYSPGKLPNAITLDDMPLPYLHPQPAPGQLPVEAPQQANGPGISGITRRRRAEDSRGRRRRTRAAALNTSCSATSFG